MGPSLLQLGSVEELRGRLDAELRVRVSPSASFP
jgi:hypothetical protein